MVRDAYKVLGSFYMTVRLMEGRHDFFDEEQ